MIKTEIQSLELSKLTPFPGNPQEVPEETMSKITNAMSEDGWYGERSLVWKFNRKHFIISGNHRVECAKRAGIESNECIVIIDKKYNWEKAKTDVLRFNSLHGGLDSELLKDFVNDMVEKHETNIDNAIQEMGFDSEIFKNDDYDYSDYDKEIESSLGTDEVHISIVIKSKDKEKIVEWLSNGEPKTPYGLGKGILKRCG